MSTTPPAPEFSVIAFVSESTKEVTYQFAVEPTSAQLATLAQQTDVNSYIAANSTVVQTIQVP